MSEALEKNPSSNGGVIQHFAQILGDLGYRAQISGDLLITSTGGIRTTIRWYEAGSLQFASGFRAVPEGFDLAAVNEFNSSYRFGSVYKEDEHLILQANFLLLDPERDDTADVLELALNLYDGLVSELRNALAEAEDEDEDGDSTAH